MRKTGWLLTLAAGAAAWCLGLGCAQDVTAAKHTFKNPLLASGPDPWVLEWQGVYYYTATTGRNLTLWKTHNMADLAHAEKKVVWTPEPGHAWSKDIWAPEIHRWNGKWYMYFAADAGANETHRIFVVENSNEDPMQGEWVLKGKVADATDRWAIDASIFEAAGKHYMIWSGWKGAENGEQDIFIARMKNPWTLDSERSLIAAPTYAWEKKGDLPKLHININEGPEALLHGRKIFIVYSASACWEDDYALGMIEAGTHSNLLDPKSWKKTDHAVFQKDAQAGVYGTGHNGFFKSQDGRDWIIYHANSAPGDGCGSKRSPRIQPFTWTSDGHPDFGKPVAATTELSAPDAR
jgi:GH43 family beta-xylosidase